MGKTDILKNGKRILSAFFMMGLLIGLSLFHTAPITPQKDIEAENALSGPTGAIENPTTYFFLAAEGSNFFSAFGQLQRFVSSTLLENQNIPSNFSFQDFFELPLLLNFKSPVPIFIKGHVLRH